MLGRPMIPSFFASSEMDQQIKQWDFVIKVKHGDTLRRLGAHVHGELMDYSIGKLRAKIISLFQFSADADLILTYIDIDGDIVTLDNDEELCDAIIGQHLNPLRITVQLKSRSDTSVDTLQPKTSSVAAEPIGYIEFLTSVPDVLQNLVGNLINVVEKVLPNSQASEVLKSEPFKSMMANIHRDVKKATTSSPSPSNQTEPISESTPTMPSLASAANPIDLNIAYGPNQSEITNVIKDSTTKQDVKKATSFSPTISNYDLGLFKAGYSNINQTEPISESTSTKPSVAVAFDPKTTETIIHSITKYDDSTRTVNAAGSLYPPEELREAIWAPNKYPVNHDGKEDSTRTVIAAGSLYPSKEFQEAIWAPNKYPVNHDGKEDDSTRTGIAAGSVYPFKEFHGAICAPNKYPVNHDGKEADGYDSYWENFISKEAELLFSDPAHSVTKECWGYSPKYSLFTDAKGSNKNTSSEADIYLGLPTYPVVLSPTMHPYSEGVDLNEEPTIHKGFRCDGCGGTYPIIGPRFKSNKKKDYDLCASCYTNWGNEAEYTRVICATPPRLFQAYYSKVLPPNPRCSNNAVSSQRTNKLESLFVEDISVSDGTVMPPLTPFTKIWRLRNNGTVSWPFCTKLVWVGGDQLGQRTSVILQMPVNGLLADEEIDVAIDFTAPSKPGRYVSYWRMQTPDLQMFGQRFWVLIRVEEDSSYFDLNVALENNTEERGSTFTIDMNTEPLDDSCETVEKTAKKYGSVDPSLVAEALANDAAEDYMGAYGYVAEEGFDPWPSTRWETLLSGLQGMGFHDRDLNSRLLLKNEGSFKRTVFHLSTGNKD